MSSLFSEANQSVLDGNYSGPFGLGFEAELVQRAAKAQLIEYLPIDTLLNYKTYGIIEIKNSKRR